MAVPTQTAVLRLALILEESLREAGETERADQVYALGCELGANWQEHSVRADVLARIEAA